MSDIRADWTERLLQLTDGLDREVARTFVDGLYAAAQADLYQQEIRADVERDE